MQMFLLTTLTMCAFAANSILNRMAVEGGHADPMGFALIRVTSGAAMLLMLVLIRQGRIPMDLRARAIGAGSLAVYMIGFSLAYLSLEAGLGALILFGVVQIAMFSAAVVQGARPGRVQIIGTLIAFGGLVWVLLPSGGWTPDLSGAVMMGAAGLGWAVYSLAGRGAADPLAVSAANFLFCLPIMILAAFLVPVQINATGVALAVLSGAIMSGLGYALWYLLLPRLRATTAASVQLSVPVIALMAGVLLLGEGATLKQLMGTLAVLGGIALSVRAAR